MKFKNGEENKMKEIYNLNEIIKNYGMTDDELGILCDYGVEKFVKYMKYEFDDVQNIKYIDNGKFEFEY